MSNSVLDTLRVLFSTSFECLISLFLLIPYEHSQNLPYNILILLQFLILFLKYINQVYGRTEMIKCNSTTQVVSSPSLVRGTVSPTTAALVGSPNPPALLSEPGVSVRTRPPHQAPPHPPAYTRSSP